MEHTIVNARSSDKSDRHAFFFILSSPPLFSGKSLLVHLLL